MSEERGGSPKSGFPSLWKANFVAFLVIFAVAVTVAVWQTRYLDRIFLDEARDHARLAAEIIRLNAQNAIQARKTSRQIISSFLKSQIRFIRYLQHVEPFTREELSAFAQEAGLSGISIMEKGSGNLVESKFGWLPRPAVSLCNAGPALREDREKRMFIFVSPFGPGDQVCVIAGIDASQVMAIQERIGLENTLREISHLAGVKFVRLTDRESACVEANGWGCPEKCDKKQDVAYYDSDSGPVVRVQFDLGEQVLILGMDAGSLRAKQRNIWMLLFFFSLILVATGGIVTWLLYRHQAAYVSKMREYEEQLFRERHEASLGRSAATIAHEIRNPLNSVSMGIQRLLMDKKGLPEMHRKLLGLIQGELARTERIISGLLSYARPLKPEIRPVFISHILREALANIEGREKFQGIGIDFRIIREVLVEADPDLALQLFENLLSNALDAQPEGEAIIIELAVENGFQVARIANGGNLPSREELDQIFEPYFTLKTRGTGLGLSICQRIMAAHNGFIRARVESGSFVVETGFPAKAGRRRDGTK